MKKPKPQLFAKPRRQSTVPATPAKWAKLLDIPRDYIKAAWFDPTEKTIVIHARLDDAAWFMVHDLYQRTDEDQLEEGYAYFILDGAPCLT